MLNAWITILIRGKWLLALLWIVLLVSGIRLLPELDFGFNIGRMLRGNDEQVSEIREFYKTFPPGDGHVMITASADHTLTINDLRAAADWAEHFRKMPEVKAVLSARTLLDLKLDGFTLDEWARLGGTGEEAIELGDGAGMETFKGNFVSRDLKSVALYIIKQGGVGTRQLHRAVEADLSEPWPDATVRVVGTEYILDQMGEVLSSNFSSLILYEILALAIVIPFFMRSLRRAYLPIITAVSALIAYFVIFILSDRSFGVMNLAGPGLILVIGLADAIHMQQKFDDARAVGHGIHESMRLMFQSVGKACMLTSLTTACGFLSLTIARHKEVHEFGIWCAIGVATAYVVVMTMLPVALAFFPGKGKTLPMQSLLNTRALRKWAAPVTVLLVILAAGTFRTTVDSSLDQELPDSAEVVQNANWFAENFRGLDRIEVELKANLRDSSVFALVEEMQRDLRDFPGISGSRSYVDAIRMTLAPDVVETEDGPMLGIQALSSGGSFPRNLLNRDLNRACIVFYRTGGFGTEAYEGFRDRIHEYSKRLPDGSELSMNGNFPMFYESTTLISQTMVVSLICSLLLITLILMVVLRSVRLALLCLVPNAIPLLVVAGISGWVGAPLHLGILIVFSVGLGLAVDDTIHLMVRFKQLQKEKPDGDLRELMDDAIVSTGFAILLTSMVLLITGACFLSSSFTTLRWTGVTLGVVAVAALLADLMVLPWLVEKFDRSSKQRKPALQALES